MGFANELTGQNGKLIYPQVQSPNFNQAAKVGWSIQKDGTAYFYNITASGIVTATEFDGNDFVINSSGAFFYSGVPALGNLILAITNAAGVDSKGNAYPAGLTLWDGTGIQVGNWATTGLTLNNTQSTGSVTVIPNSGANRSPKITFQSAVSGINLTNGSINSNVNGVAPNQFDLLGFTGPVSVNDTSKTNVGIQLKGNVPPANGTAQGVLLWFLNGAPVDLAHWDQNGFTIPAGKITAPQPGTSGPATAETWHNLGLQAGFASGGADQVPRYQFEAINGGRVRLDGVIYTTGAVLANATIATLPSAYWPLTRKRFGGMVNSISGASYGVPLINISTAGVITIAVAASGAGQQIALEGITFTTD